MKVGLTSFCLILCSLFALAQNPCPAFLGTSSSAQVSFSTSSNILYDGAPLPLGSIIVAVDEDGNCCSEPFIWNAQDTIIEIFGETNSEVGYKPNEQISFLLSIDGVCFAQAPNVFFQGHGIGFEFFSEGLLFQLSTMEASSPFKILPPLIDFPNCNQEFGSIELVVQGNGNFSYEWSHNPFLNSSKLFGLAVDTYTITVRQDGCADSVSIDLIENPSMPPFEFLIDSTITSCDTLLVSNALECDGCQYTWNNGHAEESLLITSEGQYAVTVSQEDCVTSDTLDVSFSEGPSVSILAEAQQACKGDTILLIGQGALEYQWIGTASILNPNEDSTLVVLNSNSYIYVVGTDFCKSDTSDIIISVYDQPSAGEDNCLALGGNGIQLNASGAVDYFWEANPIGPVSNPDIADPIVNPSESTVYIVEMMDENGCVTKDSVAVEVIEDIVSFIPLYNVITPNGDGKNDVLFFDGLDKSQERKLVIFDRRKKVVYQSEEYQNDWAGTHNGSQLPSGTYYYILTVNGQELRNKLTIIYE